MSPREAFIAQAGYCRDLGSPFTALLCETLAGTLEPGEPVGAAVLGWQGDPAPLADSVPLRLLGALHALVRSGAAPELGRLYPPSPLPAREALATALTAALREHPDRLTAGLAGPPQTNEVGRSGVLIGGWLEAAARTGLPLELYEIGASAGLNLLADRYRYRFADREWGSAHARPLLAPRWHGRAPRVEAALQVQSRQGCDQHPIDVRDAAARERLLAYIWPDQPARLERLATALETVRPEPPRIEQADAAEWLEMRLGRPADPGVGRLVFHSLVWGYLSSATRARIEAVFERAGRAASTAAPLGWLRFEPGAAAQLRLMLFPPGEDLLLARAHPHGEWVEWLT